jgi:hypothetical protein
MSLPSTGTQPPVVSTRKGDQSGGPGGDRTVYALLTVHVAYMKAIE